MKEKACCFTGHRNIPANEIPFISERLFSLLEKLISGGVTDFYAGGAIGFDMLAAETVLKLRNKYSHIKLHIIIPCENQEKMWSREMKNRYRNINESADEVKCLSPIYFDGCMQIRNRYMVDRCQTCIVYKTKNTGGTANTVKYAENQKLNIINLNHNLSGFAR